MSNNNNKNKSFNDLWQVVKSSQCLPSFNLQEFIAKKARTLLWGKGDKFATQDQELKEFWNKFTEDNWWPVLRNEVEEILSKVGAAYVTIDKTLGGEYYFAVAEPFWYNRVGSVFKNPLIAVIYKRIHHDNYSYVIRETWDTKKVVRQWFNANDVVVDSKNNKVEVKNEISIMDISTKLPPEKVLPSVWNHNAGVLPVMFFINRPYHNSYGQSTSTDFYPDLVGVTEFQKLLDHQFEQLFKELLFNRTRIAGNLTPDEIAKIKNDPKNELKNYIQDFVLVTKAIQGVGSQGVESAIEVIKGDPKLEEYWISIQRTIDKATEAAGYSPLQTSIAQKTEAETLFTKGNDTETTEDKRMLRQFQWGKLFSILFYIASFQKNVYDRSWSYDINSNLTSEMLNQVDKIEKLMGLGLMSRTEALSMIRNVDIEEAKAIAKEIDKQVSAENVSASKIKPVEGEEGKEEKEEQEGK